MPTNNNIPLSLNVSYDKELGTTQISWSYFEDASIDHFVLEVWNPVKRRWVPYDGKYGVVSKNG